MRFSIFSFLFFVTINSCFGQSLNFIQKRDYRKNIRKMFKDDQAYRKNNLQKDDSLWSCQNYNDSINKVKFIMLIGKYGYPSFERVKTEKALILLLHFTSKQDYNELYLLFENELKKGYMAPKDFAIWVDRCLVNQGVPVKYGVYVNPGFCPPDLLKMNKERLLIGLKEFDSKLIY